MDEQLVERVAMQICRAGGYGLCVGFCHSKRCMTAIEQYGQTARAIIPIVAEWQREREARWLYEQETANDPAIHCNRFPTWDELSECERAKRVAAIRKEQTDAN